MKQSDKRIWLSKYYSAFLVPSNYCVFCEKCSDVFYDSNGPYMCICNDQHQYETGCKYFAEDTSIKSPDYDIQGNKVIVYLSDEQIRQAEIINRNAESIFSSLFDSRGETDE